MLAYIPPKLTLKDSRGTAVYSSDSGSLELHKLKPGPYRVEVGQSQGIRSTDHFDLEMRSKDPDQTLEIPLEILKGTLRLELSCDPKFQHELENLSFFLYPEKGEPINLGNNSSLESIGLGKYMLSLSDIELGKYTLELQSKTSPSFFRIS